MAKAPDLSIIILNFNTDALLEKCLESIEKHAKGLDFEVIVANVGSTDPKEIVARFSWARKVDAENRGFSANNNLGAGEARGRILLFLNSDTELLNDGLKDAVARFDKDPKIGLLIPHLELPDGSPQSGIYGQLPTTLSAIKEKLRFGSDSDPDGPVEWVTGAALFIPLSVFNQVGGWDERYFMYMEDVDLGAEVRAKGLEATYFPKLRILHHVGASVSQSRDRVRYRRLSQNRYFRKHHGRLSEWVMRLTRLPYALVRSLRGR